MRGKQFICFLVATGFSLPLNADLDLTDLPQPTTSSHLNFELKKKHTEGQIYSANELLEITGEVKQLKTLPSVIRELFSTAVEPQKIDFHVSDESIEAVINMMIEAFHPDKIIKELENRIEGMFSAAEQLELQAFFNSDLGQRLQALVKEPFVQDEEAALAEGAQLFRSASRKRRELIKAFVKEEKRYIHTEITTFFTMFDTGIYYLLNESSMTDKKSARAYLNEMQLFHYQQQFERSASPHLPQGPINAMAFTVKNFSDTDLIKSLEFIENPVGKKFDYQIEDTLQTIFKSCLMDFKKQIWGEMGFSPFGHN